MSIKALNWAFEAGVESPESRLILIRLGNYANEWGISYPGYPNLCATAMVSKSTLWRRLHIFQETGLVSVIRRRFGQRSGGNAYLLPYHDLADEDQFMESMGDLGFTYFSYQVAWENLAAFKASSVSVSERNADVKVSGVNVSSSETHILKSSKPKNRTKHLSLVGTGTETLVNRELAEKVDDAMTWLKNKKSMRHLPPQDYLDLFMELEQYGITLDAFPDYYEWLERQGWVRLPIGVPLMKSAQTIEAYLGREQLKKKGKANESMSKYLRELEAAS